MIQGHISLIPNVNNYKNIYLHNKWKFNSNFHGQSTARQEVIRIDVLLPLVLKKLPLPSGFRRSSCNLPPGCRALGSAGGGSSLCWNPGHASSGSDSCNIQYQHLYKTSTFISFIKSS